MKFNLDDLEKKINSMNLDDANDEHRRELIRLKNNLKRTQELLKELAEATEKLNRLRAMNGKPPKPKGGFSGN